MFLHMAVAFSTLSARFPNLRRVAWIALAAATLLISAYAHFKAGYTLPIPWNDEPWYAWSSISLAENNTFFSESLNPERVLPLVPMFQVPLAIVFKIAGFSFALTRWMSWAWMALAYLGVLVLVRSRPLPLLSAAVVSLFFFGASSVVAGNMCRPEAMVWSIAVWSFVLADREQWWKALSLAAIGAWAHQVGMVFFAGVFFLFFQWALKAKARIRPSRSDWAVMALALVALAGQALFIWHFWTWFWADFGEASKESLQQNLAGRIFFSNKTPWLAAYAGLFGLALWRFRRLLVPVVLGGCAYVSMLVRPQMWYEIYNQMAFMWLAVTIPWALFSMAEWFINHGAKPLRPWLKTGLLMMAFAVGALSMLNMCYAHGFVTGPNNYPAKLGWGWGMQVDPHPYLTEQDIQTISREIEKHAVTGKKQRVFFMPEGDALFFHGRMPANTIPYQGVYTEVRGDMAVFRLSRHQPNWMRDQHVMKYLRLYGGEGLEPFYERDGTEKWIFIPPKAE
jgi:hypothetical protein